MTTPEGSTPAPSGSLGILLMALGGVVGTCELVLGKVLIDLGWPFFRLRAFSAFLIAVFLLLAIKCAGVERASSQRCKWVCGSACFGTLGFFLSILGVQFGATPGDVSALSSTNVVFASLLGYAFLREPIRYVHALALLCAISGALLICKPSFVFGGEKDIETLVVLGQSIAPLAGFANALSFICVRLSDKVSVWYLPLSTCLISSLALFVLPMIFPGLEKISDRILTRNPMQTVGFTVAVLLVAFSTISLKYIGPKFCPAVVSTTVFNTSKIVCGYIAQVLLFGTKIESLTMLGAALMLISVILLASNRKKKDSAIETAGACNQARSSDDGVSETVDSFESESIASFAASEFVEYELHEKPAVPGLRARVPIAQNIGFNLHSASA